MKNCITLLALTALLAGCATYSDYEATGGMRTGPELGPSGQDLSTGRNMFRDVMDTRGPGTGYGAGAGQGMFGFGGNPGGTPLYPGYYP